MAFRISGGEPPSGLSHILTFYYVVAILPELAGVQLCIQQDQSPTLQRGLPMLAAAFATEAMPARPTTYAARHAAAEDGLSGRLIYGPTRTFETKEHIFREGDVVAHVYQVEAGHVCIYKMLPDGRRQVIDFAYPGDMIGLGAMGEHSSNAQVTNRARVRLIPVASLRQVMRDDAALGFKLYEAMSRELSAARELLLTVSQRTATERVASFLLALSRRNERNGEDPAEFVLPMTRNDIADFLGLTIETVSRTFTKLRCEGVIDLAQSVLVTIVDAAALARIADGRTQ
jgi:CRP-like cAMP-binding protein